MQPAFCILAMDSMVEDEKNFPVFLVILSLLTVRNVLF